MINIIIGAKGTGKTKRLIDTINGVAATDKGNVVCIVRGKRLQFDLDHSIRLIDIEEFDIDSYSAFYGFICGILSEDFDISHIFIESMTKVVNPDIEQFGDFIYYMERLLKRYNINITITISVDRASMPENALKYCTE